MITLSHEFADTLPELCTAWQAETPPDPQLVVVNEPLARELGLDPQWLRTREGIDFMCGTNLPDGAQPVAMGYAGHQFGQLSPKLGDGRALLLGEARDSDGRLRDIHLKGSGPTPFSRGGDGWGALAPMLREYLISEAMHALGVPSSHSLAVISTGRKIQRTRVEPAALLVRVASSHIRIGTFQYAQMVGGDELTAKLADYTRERHFPDAQNARELFDQALDRQLATVAAWMRLGFIHGVMNTDNTALSGETMDYGPCAFMESFDNDTVFSSIDHAGRYRYRNQPLIVGWNYARLAEALLPLFDEDADKAHEHAQQAMNSFEERWQRTQARETSAALDTNDDTLAKDFHELLATAAPDLTSTQRALVDAARDDGDGDTELSVHLGNNDQALDWVERWKATKPDPAALADVHPVVIPRNHLVEKALGEATEGDVSNFHELVDVVTTPFAKHEQRFREPAPASFSDSYRTFCGT